MNQDHIKKDIYYNLKKFSIILAVLFSLLIGGYFLNHNYQDKLNKLNADLQSIESNIKRKKDEYTQSTQSLKEYLLLSADKLPTDSGFALGRDRLQTSVEELKKLRQNYLFKKLNLSISEIKENSQARSSSFSVYEGSINIDYSGATDEYVFSFINDIKNTFPGYLYIKKLELKKNADITEASTAAYLSSSADAQEGFVSGALELDWLTLKAKSQLDKSKTLPNNNAKPAPNLPANNIPNSNLNRNINR